MTWLLGRGGREALCRIAADDSLVALDFDGTLAPIVGDRDAAAMRPTTLALLRRVAACYPTVVISGRSQADVRARLKGVPLRGLVGNHGAEPPPSAAAGRRWRRQARGWAEALRAASSDLAGVEIEEKGVTVTAHYRHAARPALARPRLERTARGLQGARVIGGKRVVSVAPAAAPHKGDALASAARRLGVERVLFVGDDDTDEDAFGHDLGVPATMVRVGPVRRTQAGFLLRGQEEMDHLLELLSWLREEPGPAGRRGRRPRGGRPRSPTR